MEPKVYTGKRKPITEEERIEPIAVCSKCGKMMKVKEMMEHECQAI